MSRRTAAFTVLALFLAALPAAAADRVIHRGIDPWTTVPEMTYMNFEVNPLPAGFFCAAFPGFTDMIWFKGVPLASDASGALGTTDTIIERLDNAVFNKNGVARTRVRVRALQLEGIETLKTVCGDYTVKVMLDGEQPLSTMRIIRETAEGGRYLVPLALNVKFIFTRIDDPSEQFELSQAVRFKVNPQHHWSYRQFAPNAKRVGSFMVDTDWDGTPDALLPGTSNFAGGRIGNSSKAENTVFCASSDGSGHAVY